MDLIRTIPSTTPRMAPLALHVEFGLEPRPQFHEKTPKRGRERMKIVAGEGKIAKFGRPHPSDLPTLRTSPAFWPEGAGLFKSGLNRGLNKSDWPKADWPKVALALNKLNGLA